MNTHPSFLALDGHALDPRPGEVQTHLLSCEQCQRHLTTLRVATPMPMGLLALPGKPPRRSWVPWLLFIPVAAAMALVFAAAIKFAAPAPLPQFTAKGTPTAALWLNRDGKVIVWNGEPVHAGDAVRIEVVPAGFTHLTVFDESSKVVLYEARIPKGTSSLTPAWKFDGHLPTESLRVVLSDGPVQLEKECASTVEVHCSRFSLRVE